MRLKSILILLMVFSLLATMVSAVNINIQMTAVENSIFPDVLAEFTLTIENRESEDLRLSLQATDIEWAMITEPASHASVFEVASGESASTTIFLTPTNKQLQPGLHAVRIDIKDPKTGDVARTQALVNIKPKDPFVGEYLPSVRGTLSLSEPNIDPRKTTQITVEVENLNPRNIEELEVTLQSESIRETRTISISPKGQEGDSKSVVFGLDLDDLHTPGEEHLRAVLSAEFQNKTFTFETPSVQIQIMEYGDIEENTTAKTKWFKTTQTHALKNIGNKPRTATVKIPYGLIERLFVSVEGGEKVREGIKTYLIIEEELDKDESMEVIVVYNYRWLVILILVAAIVIGAYYKHRSPIVIKKEAKVLNKFEGGISKVKVMLIAKNRSRKEITNIVVSDKIPHLVEITKEFEMGVLHPTKILRHKTKGTISKWEIERLDGGEERIMTYNITAKLSIVGELQLPGAVVKFSPEKGRTRAYKSKGSTLSSL